MPLDVGRITHLAEQMHRSEDDAGDPITDGYLLAADGARGLEWVDPATIGTGTTPTFSGARVYNSGNISLTNGVETVLTFDSERYDTDSYHSTSSNTDRLTAPSTGYYHIGANARITTSPGDPSYILLQANGTTTIALDFIANDSFIPMGLVSCDYQLTAGDYVKVFVFVNAGSKNATNNANYSPEFWMHLIGT